MIDNVSECRRESWQQTMQMNFLEFAASYKYLKDKRAYEAAQLKNIRKV